MKEDAQLLQALLTQSELVYQHALDGSWESFVTAEKNRQEHLETLKITTIEKTEENITKLETITQINNGLLSLAEKQQQKLKNSVTSQHKKEKLNQAYKS